MGGYAGLGEKNPDARDVKLFETILSGDLLGNDESKEPSRIIALDEALRRLESQRLRVARVVHLTERSRP